MMTLKTLLASVTPVAGFNTPVYTGGVTTFDGATVASLGPQPNVLAVKPMKAFD